MSLPASIPSPSPMLVAMPAPDGSTAIDVAKSLSRSRRYATKVKVMHLALLPMDQHMLPIMPLVLLVDMPLMWLALHWVLICSRYGSIYERPGLYAAGYRSPTK